MKESSLDVELELISSSLLPSESLISSDASTIPRTITIVSEDSKLSIHVSLQPSYPAQDGVYIEIKGDDIHREEGKRWRDWVAQRKEEYDPAGDYPLYQILTTHFLPLLSNTLSPPISKSSTNPQPTQSPSGNTKSSQKPHQTLLTSHHLLAPSKRKDLQHLSSTLSLIGFCKTGYPGIIYVTGEKEDLEIWLKEVKSWQWLALRVRIGIEPCQPVCYGDTGRGREDGARHGKGRGEWREVEKISEALEIMRGFDREGLLLDLGIGGITSNGDRNK